MTHKSVAEGLSDGRGGRSFNWAQTQLGPMEQWPPELRTAVATVLNSPHPMLLVWGTDWLLVYNDAAQAVLQPRHPYLRLGHSAISLADWYALGQDLQQVWQTGQPIWTENQSLQVQRPQGRETGCFTWLSYPIWDATGAVQGVMATAQETTVPVIEQRRLRLLQHLSQQMRATHTLAELGTASLAAIAADPDDVPFAILYWLDPMGVEVCLGGSVGLENYPEACPERLCWLEPTDGRWPLATVGATGQPRYVEHLTESLMMTRPRAQVGASAAMVWPLGGCGEQRLTGFLILGLSSTLPHDAAYRQFLQLIVDQVNAALLVHDREFSARATARSRHHPSLEHITDAFVALDPEWRYTYVNQEAARLLGRSSDELIGKQLWRDGFGAAVDQPISQQLRQAMQTQVPLRTETYSSLLGLHVEVNAYPSAAGLSIYFRDISDRKQVERQLRASEEFNRRIIDSSHDCIKVLDVDGRLLSINVAGQKLLEICDVGSLLYTQWTDFWQGADRAAAEAAIAAARLGQTGRFQASCPTQRGQLKWWDVLVTPIWGAQGQVVEILALSRDMTELKQAEQVLRTSERLYRTLSDAVPDFIWSCDLSGKTTFVNSRWLDYTGLTLEAVLAHGSRSVIHPDDWPQVTQQWERAIQQNTTFEAEFRYRRHDGVYRWFISRAVPMTDAAGQIEQWIGTTTDIDERKQAEAEREQLLLQLKTERAQFEAVLQQMPAGVVIADAASGHLILANEQIERMLGGPWQSAADSLGCLGAFQGVDPQGRCYTPGDWPLVRSLRTGEVIMGEEIQLRWEDGRQGVVEANAAPIRDSQGQIQAAVVIFRDITRQWQAEQALRDSETRLRTLIEQAPLAVFIADTDGLFQEVNTNACRLLGYDREELLGRSVRLHLCPSEQAHLDAAKAVLLAGQPYGGEWMMLHRDGTPIATEVSTNMLPNGQWQIFARDIGDRKRAEVALLQSEERFRQLAENIAAVFWIRDTANQDFLYVSPAYEQIWGYPSTRLLDDASWWVETIHATDRDRIRTVYTEQLVHGHLDEEYRVVRADGSTRWIRDRGFPILEDDGVIRRVAGIAEDITDRKRVEAALRISDIFARARVEELETLMETVPAAIWIAHDPDCYTMTANRMAHHLMRAVPGSVVTATPAEGGYPFPFKIMRQGQELSPDELPMQRVSKTGQAIESELEFVFNDGTIHYIYGKAVPLHDEQGQIRGAIGAFIDISERMQAEAERDQLLAREQAARAEAEAANRIKDEFLAVLSHELRSPLNPILGWANLLQRRKMSEEKLAQALATIERNAKLQVQLIDDLLDVSRILRGKLRLTMAVVDLAPTVLAALETVRLAAEAKSIHLQTQIAPDVAPVLGDAGRLQQVVWNLLSNAVKFTPAGGRVDVRLSQVGSEAQIQVQDSGKGIRPDFLPHVFDYFRQEDGTTTRTFGGLGLGLAIVRYLMELHGGSVWADSPGEGQGATFTVRLPRLPSNYAAHTVADSHRSDSPTGQALQDLQILLVEDDVDSREFVTWMLEQNGATVIPVASARAALEHLAQAVPDVLVSDIGMPGMDGFMLMQQVRSHPAEQIGTIPAIALTAYASDSDAEKALAVGFQQHVAKPAEPDHLVKAILQVIASR